MVSDQAAAAAEAEFDVRTGLLGIAVPADLKGGVLRGYQGIRAMTALLREVHAHGGDPAGEEKETPSG
jgi:hypothetical protein